MTAEIISEANIKPLTELMLELWADCSFDEELANCKSMIGSNKETCYLAKEEDNYVAFIHVAIRADYVEGTEGPPVAYIEAIFVKPGSRKLGIAKKLVALGEEWGRQKGCTQFASDAELTNSGSIAFHKKIGFQEVNRVVCFVKEIK